MSVSREDIVRFLDGDMRSDEAARLEARLADDAALRADVARERALAQQLRAAFAPIMSEDVPASLVSAVLDTPVSRRYRLRSFLHGVRGAVRTRQFWGKSGLPAAVALACGLLIGIGVTHNVIEGGLLVPDGKGVRAGGALATALDRQLASTQTSADPVTIGVSFRAADGRDCRSFSTSATAGLACRAGSAWQIAALVPAPAEQKGAYAEAGSTMPPGLRATISQLISGTPFDAAAERHARDNGWK